MRVRLPRSPHARPHRVMLARPGWRHPITIESANGLITVTIVDAAAKHHAQSFRSSDLHLLRST